MINILTIYKQPKIGLSFDECEDSFMIDAINSVIAISDGATESSFSKLWSSEIVNHFINYPTTTITENWLLAPRKEFYSKINIKDLPWHALEKLNRGTYASLVGLIVDEENKMFSTVCIGDSCIGWKNNKEAVFLPYSSPEDFSRRPMLLSTLNEDDGGVPYGISIRSRHLPEGTTYIYMMTDAIGQWFLKDIHLQGLVDDFIETLKNKEATITDLEYMRLARYIKNDDVTLVVVEVIL